MAFQGITPSAPPTQADIARDLGVSGVAVHRALNGHPGVSKALKEKILTLAKRSGYRTNTSAKSMAKGRFDCITLLMSTVGPRSTLPGEVLRGINQELSARRQRLMLAVVPDEKLQAEGEVPQILRENCSDGLLIDYTSSIPKQLIEQIGKYSVPSIWMNSMHGADCVYPDDSEAAERATRRLLELGHRRIVYLGPRVEAGDDQHYSRFERREGYERAMRQAGLASRALLSGAGDEWVATMANMWRDPQRPTALVAYSFPSQAIYTAMDAGLRIPRDVAIVTFGEPTFNVMTTRISYMAIPEYELGRRATQMLLEKIEAPDLPLAACPLRFGEIVDDTCVPPRE